MLDLVIRAGKVVDGTGGPPRTADVGVADGRIIEVGRCTEQAQDEIDADGLLVTPGFVDIHTHFDGQATWDPYLAPSAWHGVTTVAMGNCGVGFAPAWPDRHEWLISPMEGVEDIPGAALAEGLTWGWQTFPEYLDALDGLPRVLDIGAHVPHAALRAYVMGERGANPDEMPTDAELQQMSQLLSEAVAAGAVGIGSSRTQNHRTSQGDPLGTLRAAKREMVALAGALKGTDGVIQMISDAYQSTDPEFVAAELELIAAMATAAQRPLSFSLLQPASAPDRWREIQKWVMSLPGQRVGDQDAGRAPADRHPAGAGSERESLRPLSLLRGGQRLRPAAAGGRPGRSTTTRAHPVRARRRHRQAGSGRASHPGDGRIRHHVPARRPGRLRPSGREVHRQHGGAGLVTGGAWPTTCCSSGAGRSCSMSRWPTSSSGTCRR